MAFLDACTSVQKRCNLIVVSHVNDFRREVARRWDLAGLEAQVRASQARRRVVDAALGRGAPRSWDFQPIKDASKSYVRNTIALDDWEAMARFPRVAG